MKYSAATYAKAFVAAASEPKANEDALVTRFLALIARNGDLPSLKKILVEAERLMLRRTGGRKILVESARPIEREMLKQLAEEFRKEDRIETTVNPELIAGVKVTIDGEWMVDATMKRKLEKLFMT